MISPERIDNETPQAYAALCDYLRMGAGRSLAKLRQKYAETTAEKPPTVHLRTLQKWSSKYEWQSRAALYDAKVQEAKNEEIARLRSEALAADYERIRQLTDIYRELRSEFDTKGVWYTDTKLSAKGDTVDVDVFNTQLLTQMRGVLDDVAKEVGGRKNVHEHTGGIDLRHLSDEQLRSIIEG